MKRLVIKTVAITVAAIIVIMAAIYLTFALFFPKTLAGTWKDMGNYSIAAKYYEKQYDKSKDVDDLATLCVYLDEKDDSARAAKYLKLLTEDENFNAHCEKEKEEGGFKYTAYEFYYGKFTVAEFYANGINAAILVATKAVSAGYTENNAFYVLLLEKENLSESDRGAIVSAITEIKDGLTDAEKQIADKDIEFANAQ